MEPGASSNAAVGRSVQPSRHVNRGGFQARFFIEGDDDPQAARQRPLAVNALAERCFVSVTVEDRDAVLMAVDAFDQGLDVADALHVARSRRAAGFATFDRRLAGRAQGQALLPPVERIG